MHISSQILANPADPDDSSWPNTSGHQLGAPDVRGTRDSAWEGARERRPHKKNKKHILVFHHVLCFLKRIIWELMGLRVLYVL